MRRVWGQTINLTCTEHLFPEFADLLFGTHTDGSVYFDASAFADSKGLGPSAVDAFFNAYSTPINAIISLSELRPADICTRNPEGHLLIESSLTYLFISFVEPRFLLYMMDRMNELFSQGITVSDTYLVTKMKSRIPKEVIMKLMDAGTI